MAEVTVKDGKATIQTSRLLLREARPSDLQGLHTAMGDEEVMRYWYSPFPLLFDLPLPQLSF